MISASKLHLKPPTYQLSDEKMDKNDVTKGQNDIQSPLISQHPSQSLTPTHRRIPPTGIKRAIENSTQVFAP